MGIIKNLKRKNCTIGIWNMSESLDDLRKLYKKDNFSRFRTEKREKEFLSARLLLDTIKPNSYVTYNKYGAPEIGNKNFVSISHSKNLVAIVVSQQRVGLDIELISEKSLELSAKFISKESGQNLTKEKATLIWCCKEAIFKWYQKGGIDFLNDIWLSPFVLCEKGEITGNLKSQSLTLNYERINNHYLVYVCK